MLVSEAKPRDTNVPKGIISIIQCNTNKYIQSPFLYYVSVTYWLAIKTAEMLKHGII